LPILDDQGNYVGAISKNLFLRTLHRSQADAEQDQEPETATQETVEPTTDGVQSS
jgi:glycine betaine/proline transport system ATP-binding protein